MVDFDPIIDCIPTNAETYRYGIGQFQDPRLNLIHTSYRMVSYFVGYVSTTSIRECEQIKTADSKPFLGFVRKEIARGFNGTTIGMFGLMHEKS